jgi:hypothetical protein
MIRTAVAAMTLLALAGSAVAQHGGRAAPPPPAPTFQGTISIHEEVIVRLPRRAPGVAPFSDPRTEWTEHRGPRCIESSRIAGAAVLGPDSVDLVLRDRTRVRARLERGCPALDYYRGFYVSSTGDGRICADRDMVRSRAGASCQIEAFRVLRPAAH